MGFGDFLKGIASLVPGVGQGLQQANINKQVKEQAALTEAERRRLMLQNAGFLSQYGSQLAGPKTTTQSQTGTRSGVSRTTGTTQQRQIVDPAQAALKAQLESVLGGQVGRPEEEYVSGRTRAATAEEIAARERAMRETLEAAAVRRGVPTSGLDMLARMPAQAEASAARLQAESQFDEMGYQRARAAEEALGRLLQGWKGSDTNVDQTTRSNESSTSEGTYTDPTGNLAALYNMTMFSPGAEQKAMTLNPWVSGGQALGTTLAGLYGAEGMPSWWGGAKKPASPIAALPAARPVGPQSPMSPWGS